MCKRASPSLASAGTSTKKDRERANPGTPTNVHTGEHSGVRQFEVSLKDVLNEIKLTVHDGGVGFMGRDPD